MTQRGDLTRKWSRRGAHVFKGSGWKRRSLSSIGVSKTALGTAAGRALESRRHEKDRLFIDHFAMELLPLKYRAVVHLLELPILGAALLALRERQIPGIMGNLICRTRFIDDTVRDGLGRGCEQVAILGAGLDSRAYRIPGADRVRVFELDRPATQAWKRERLARLGHEPPLHVTFVPVNFEQQDLRELMVEAGFREGARTLVVWEGVTQYIGASAVDATFRDLRGAVALGSRIVFTYIHRGLIDDTAANERTKRLLAELERQGEPWVFGIYPAEISEYLAARGFHLLEDVGAADYRARYLTPIGRVMDVFEGERVAVAEIADSGEAKGGR